jgi:pyruvate dehydrogenase E2 component (dihydrolipoamide acetyltransferase)
MIEILVPPLSQTLDTLVLIEWLIKPGDPVRKGQPLFTVETDKATLEVEAPASGVLESVSAQPGDEIQVRRVIGLIRQSSGSTGDSPSPAESRPSPVPLPSTEASEKPALHQSATHQPAESSQEPASQKPIEVPQEPVKVPQKPRIFASPRARQLAMKKGLTLEELDGSATGPQGMIVERDVRAYLQRTRPRLTPLAQRMAQEAGLDPSSLSPSQPGDLIRKADVEASLPQPGEGPTPSDQPEAETPSIGHPLSSIRKTITVRMTESHLNTAPVTYLSEVDATRLVKLRKNILHQVPRDEVRPTLTDFLIRITALVLKKHPQLNATFDGSLFHISESIHIALAVDTERGLVVPVLSHAGGMGLSEIAVARSQLVRKALAAKLKPDEMSGGTFTISNLGTLGIDHFTPIINPPQVAILGVGRLREVPAFRKGKLRRRYSLGLSLTCDHRIIDGAPAARFLADICRLVEQPDLVWL